MIINSSKVQVNGLGKIILSYERHREAHMEEKKNKCDICEKELFLELRLRQHVKIHENPNTKKCHYYNNDKVCPFEPLGCKFRHEKSEQCSKSTSCEIRLCSTLWY